MNQHKHIEGKGKPTKVVAPEGCEKHLTAGKEYLITRTDKYPWGKLGHGIYLEK